VAIRDANAAPPVRQRRTDNAIGTVYCKLPGALKKSENPALKQT
jgi:hypothetical protein